MYLPYKFRKLPIDFDADRLQSELASIPDKWWVTHSFDETSHDVVPLITHNGTLKNADGTDNHSFVPPFHPTEHLQRLPYMRGILHSLGAEPTRCRLMRVGPGENVKAHQDRNPHWNDKVRIHIPVITDPAVKFHLWSDSPEMRWADHEAVTMKPGEPWVFNTWYFHSVTNDSPSVSRVHLVGDFSAVGKLREMLFDGCSAEMIEEADSFDYPEYDVSPEIRRWAEAGAEDAEVQAASGS